MKTLLKISLAFILFISYNNLFASGWQQKLDLINPSDRATNSEIEMMPNGNCLIATNFAQPWDTAIYLHQYKKIDGEILLFNINYVFNKNVQKVHAIKYISAIQKYILIYEEYIPNISVGIYYQIIESFDPFVIQPKHLMYDFAYDDLYTNKFVVTETATTIETGFSTAKIDNVNNHVRDTIKFIKAQISLSNLDALAQIDSVIIPNRYSSTSIQHPFYTMKKVQDDYILNLSNADGSLYFAKLIKIHNNLSWDSAIVYFPNGYIAPQLLDNGNVLVKTDFFDNNNYSKTNVYNNNLEFLYSIDSTSMTGFASFYIEPQNGKVINLEADYYPNQTVQLGEYGMTKEMIDITNRKANPQEIWYINYPQEILYRNFQVVSQTTFKDGYAYLFGYIAGPNNRNLYLIQIDSLGNVYNKLIQGNVIGDFNNDCIEDSGIDVHMRGITITAKLDTVVFFTTTDNDGFYQFATNEVGVVKLAPRNNFRYPLWRRGNCSDTFEVNLSTGEIIDSINFNFTPTVVCTNLTVDVVLRRFRHLDPQIYYHVNYCNHGTIIANDAYIDIKVDPNLIVDSAGSYGLNTLPFTFLGNDTYRINVGNVSIFECDNFILYLHEKPTTILGQTVCIESHIYPDDVCVLPNYTGSIIEASAVCLGDSVRLQLENIGGNMQQLRKYIVIEDQVIRKVQNYQLQNNETITEMYPSDSGKTYRIVAEQESDFPSDLGDKYVTAAIEGCRPQLQDDFSTGYILQHPNYDGAPYFSVDCKMIVGSFDPNEKQASPIGYGTQHFIEENTDINYTIHFQNTGNDTAYKVVVVDTISATLDINTIIPTVASHDYRFERIDSNVVQFVFDSIYLVDSVHNEPLSHGFVKFSIKQKINNPIGTVINNKASIYFDRNEAIVTNTTFHTIGKDFIDVKIISSTKNTKYNVRDIKIFPNPFHDKTQIIVDSDNLENAVLILVNIDGQIIKTIPATNKNTFNIYREDLSSGLYLFKIVDNGNEVSTGKLIAQ